jgi:heat shock protein HtpX
MPPARGSFRRDYGLVARMVLTMLLLVALYMVAIAALLAGGAGVAVMVLVVAALVLAQTFLSDRLALVAMGAKVTEPAQAPQLHAIVERLCVQADMPKPRVAVADTPMPNAFAMGRTRKGAVVCATTGIMAMLTPKELEAVMAHELSHVHNRDVLVMTIASFFASVALMIVLLVRVSWRLFLGFAVIALLFWAVSYFLMLALSRYREFTADRDAALITGNPSGLAAALTKLSAGIQAIPQRDLREAAGMNAFFVVPTSVKRRFGGLFSTHPPIEKRIARLAELESELQHGH